MAVRNDVVTIACDVCGQTTKLRGTECDGRFRGAFNTVRWWPDGTPTRAAASVYSAVRCPVCSATWRTKAAYVAALPDAPENWWRTP